ncbi:MAG TPA: hypothetical protein VI197_00640 [Polyangiaceae bacterium]
MSSATKHDAGHRAEVRLPRRLSAALRVRRQTPLVPVAKADLDLCRIAIDAPAPASLPGRVAGFASVDLARETRAALRSAYRPKPESGGTYSVVGCLPVEQLTLTRPDARSRRPRSG